MSSRILRHPRDRLRAASLSLAIGVVCVGLLCGVIVDMIRLCIGIEHIDDILADLDQALAASA